MRNGIGMADFVRAVWMVVGDSVLILLSLIVILVIVMIVVTVMTTAKHAQKEHTQKKRQETMHTVSDCHDKESVCFCRQSSPSWSLAKTPTI